MDWNYHLHLPVATKKTGEQIFSRKYNQRAQQWDMKIVKADKGYEYIPLLIAKMFHARMEDVDLVTWHISVNESDPRLLASTIAAKSPPPLAELIKRHSRFGLPSESSEKKKGEEESSPMEH